MYDIKKIIRDYWQPVVGILTIGVVFARMEFGIIELRMYIDYKIENINEKVDNTIQQIQQMTAQSAESDKQTNEHLNLIIDMGKEQSERLDRMWEHEANKKN